MPVFTDLLQGNAGAALIICVLAYVVVILTSVLAPTAELRRDARRTLTILFPRYRRHR